MACSLRTQWLLAWQAAAGFADLELHLAQVFSSRCPVAGAAVGSDRFASGMLCAALIICLPGLLRYQKDIEAKWAGWAGCGDE